MFLQCSNNKHIFQRQVRFALTGGGSKKQKYPTFNLVYKIAYAQH